MRFLIGDTDATDPLVQDEEIEFAVANQSNLKLAASLCLRALAAKYSRLATRSVGGVSQSCSDLARAFSDRAKELDPTGITTAPGAVLPSFGGLTISGKETLAEDRDAVQPRFNRGEDDIIGGYPDGSRGTDDERIR